MDLISLLGNIIKKRNYSKEEAIRLIYLYTCGKYSFDTRYASAIRTGDNDLIKDIIDYKPSIKRADFKDITCVSFCESIIGPLIENLVTRNIDYIGEGLGHRVITVPFDGEEIFLDGTEGDLTRVKLHMSTKGFGPDEFEMTPKFAERLREIDKKLGYIKDEYTDEKLARIKDVSSVDEFAVMCNVLLTKHKITNYSDAKYTLSEIFDVFFNDHIDLYSRSASYNYLGNTIGLYYIDGYYYKLSKDEYYTFKPITLSEFYYLTKNFKMYDVEELINPDLNVLKSLR